MRKRRTTDLFEYDTEYDAFNEGVEPGGLLNKDDIKVLICYLLKTVDMPISREQIGNIMQDRCIANYFEAMDALSDLLSNGNVKSDFNDETEYFRITDLGRDAVALLEKELPKTVREKAVKSALRFITLEKNERDNEVKIEPCSGGYTISFTMKDGDTVFMELSMFVPDSAQAQKLKENFIEDPVHVYSTILASLMID